MKPSPSHRAAGGARCLPLLLACAALCLAAPAAAAARRAAPQYPSGATRPTLQLRGVELARARQSKQTAATKTPKKTAAKLHGDPARALLAFAVMQKYYYLAGTGLYRGEPYSYLWPFSQALAATVSLSYIPGESTKLAHELHVREFGLQRYYEAHPQPAAPAQSTAASVAPLPSFAGTVAPPLGAGGPSYYDDNEWVGIELARVYRLHHEAFALEQAERIMAFVMAGWETTKPSGKPLPCPGGVPFSTSATNNSRNTVTDGPGAELALQLYRITREAQYLHFALMAYDWVRECLLTPQGLYADHIEDSGAIEPTVWSYNQGSMIGAGALLYQATGNSAYLYQARQTAKAALAYFNFERMELENPFFAAVFFRNLMYLDSITHDPPGAKLAQAFVNYAWGNLRLENDLFVSGSPSAATLLGQAAIVQIYALLSTPPASYF